MRKVRVVGLVAVAVAVVVAWLLWRGEAPSDEPGRATPSEVATPALAERANALLTAQLPPAKGDRVIRGRVLGLDGPVEGAVVVASNDGGEEVLSDLPCRCDSRCGQKLLECGCDGAAVQLVELVLERRGEAPPVARATSAADGSFTLKGLEEGTFALWAEKPGKLIGLRLGVKAGEEGAARGLIEVEHDVAQKDHVEGIGGAIERQRSAAEIGLTEIAELADLGLDGPVFADVVKVANDEARGQSSVDLDTMIAAGLGALDDFITDVGAFDGELPPRQHGEVLKQHHGHAVGLLTGGAGGAPKAEGAVRAARLNDLGKQFLAQEIEGAEVAEEAGLIDGHGLGDLALQRGIFLGTQLVHQFVEARHALVAQDFGKAGVEEVVPRGVEDILGHVENQLAEVAVLGACDLFHG